MDKYAAEKIAQQAYTVGTELAFQKIANKIKTFSTARHLAEAISNRTARAGKTIAEAGSMGKVYRHIPGSDTRKAYKTLRASGITGSVDDTIKAMNVQKQVDKLPEELDMLAKDLKLSQRLDRSGYSPFMFSMQHDPFYGPGSF